MQRNTGFSLEEAQKILPQLTGSLSRLEAEHKTQTSEYRGEITKVTNALSELSKEAFLQLDQLTKASEGKNQPISHKNYANLFNNISKMVLTDIHSSNNLQQQIDKYQRWVLVLDQSLKKGDLFLSMSISAALNDRLNLEVQKLIGKGYAMKLSEFDHLEIGNFKNREVSNRIIRNNPDAIPYFGVFQARQVQLNQTRITNTDRLEGVIKAAHLEHLIPPQLMSAAANDPQIQAISSQYMDTAKKIKALTEQNEKIPGKLSAVKERLEAELGQQMERMIRMAAGDKQTTQMIERITSLKNDISEIKIKMRDGEPQELEKFQKEQMALEQELEKHLTKVLANPNSPLANIVVNQEDKKNLAFAVAQCADSFSETKLLAQPLQERQEQLKSKQEKNKEKERMGVDLKSLNYPEQESSFKVLSEMNEQARLGRLGEKINHIKNTLEAIHKQTTSNEVKANVEAMLTVVNELDKNKLLDTQEKADSFSAAFKKLNDMRDETQRIQKNHGETLGQKTSNTSTSFISAIFSTKKAEGNLDLFGKLAESIKSIGFASAIAESKEFPKNTSVPEVSSSSPQSVNSTPIEHDGVEPIDVQGAERHRTQLEVKSVQEEKKDDDSIKLSESQEVRIQELYTEQKTVGYNKPLPPVPSRNTKEELKVIEQPEKKREEPSKQDHKLNHEKDLKQPAQEEKNKVGNEFNNKAKVLPSLKRTSMTYSKILRRRKEALEKLSNEKQPELVSRSPGMKTR